MADAPSRAVELIDTFDRNIEAYRSQQYNEAQIRREFIDPFFEELGWDITNKAGHAQAYKDVIHEDAIKIGGYTKIAYVKKLPIRTIDFDNPDDKAKHDKMINHVDKMLDLHKKLPAAKVPAEKTRIQRQINSTEKQIDNLVYDLYNLTEEEIKIIEQNS